MNDLQLEIWNELCKLSGEEVARLFTDWLGEQILDKDFRVYLGNEGYMSEYEEEELDEEDGPEIESGDDFVTFCERFSNCLTCPIYKKYAKKISTISCPEEFEKMKEEDK